MLKECENDNVIEALKDMNSSLKGICISNIAMILSGDLNGCNNNEDARRKRICESRESMHRCQEKFLNYLGSVNNLSEKDYKYYCDEAERIVRYYENSL